MRRITRWVEEQLVSINCNRWRIALQWSGTRT